LPNLVVHADDVGIGKTIEAALIAVRYWTEAKLSAFVPSLPKQCVDPLFKPFFALLIIREDF
jgi:hypothetical protein